MRPLENEYAPFYARYVAAAEGNSIAEIIQHHSEQIHTFIESIPESKADYAYASGKWTIKELLQHLIDTERIFVYRAVRFARKDKTDLPGYEEDDYVKYSYANTRTLASLKEEFSATRKSSNLFLLSLNETALQQSGTANGSNISVNAIAFIVFGHILHHIGILKERYL